LHTARENLAYCARINLGCADQADRLAGAEAGERLQPATSTFVDNNGRNI
jgi:hypothetical protein